jgi:glycosyltransferase involved in cell wall biosynthesis
LTRGREDLLPVVPINGRCTTNSPATQHAQLNPNYVAAATQFDRSIFRYAIDSRQYIFSGSSNRMLELSMASAVPSETPSGGASASPLLSVVIPAYNEIATMDRILAAVKAVDIDKEIIVVDDDSTDGTRERLAEIAAADRSIRLIQHPQNRGKGAALRTGFAGATGRYVVVQDADLEYDPADFAKLLRPMLEDNADAVFGSRFIGGECHRVLYSWHWLGNRLLTLISNAFTNLSLTDMETCYKMVRREVLQDIKLCEDGFGFEPEITAKLAAYRFNGRPLRIYEVGISYHGRTYEEGKKIGWKDGLRALWCILKYNCFSR